MVNKIPLLSISLKDCEVSVFRGSGSGGQAKNKTSSGIRVEHTPSGAIGKASDAREQTLNKKNAFLRMTETKEFKTWLKLETSRLMGQPSIEDIVDESMQLKNIKVEVKDEEGTWFKTSFEKVLKD